jgi:hypothetical protein
VSARVLRISPDLALPLDAVTSTLVIYGGKGMGKTNLGSVLVEELARARQRFCFIDPVGVAWGLRHSADGNGPGIEVLVLGGREEHADIPIEPTAGAIVADLVADEHVSTIIDISRRPDGRMWTLGEKIKFVTDFFLRLYQRQGERREPLMVVLDEAARYVPQLIPAGQPELARCVGAIEQVAEEGRNVGIGIAFLTQRSARMNKSVSELADAMIAFRTVGPRSIDAILDWFGEHVDKSRWKDLLGTLRELPVGQALVVSPGWLQFEGVVRIRARETFDSSATPKAGTTAAKPRGKAAQPDLGKYRTRMAETIEKAAASDPKRLQAKVGELERDKAKLEGRIATLEARPAKAETKIVEKIVEKRVEVRILTDKDLKVLTEAWMAGARAGTQFEEASERVAAILRDAKGAAAAATAIREMAGRGRITRDQQAAPVVIEAPERPRTPAPPPPERRGGDMASDVQDGQGRAVRAFADHAAAGREAAEDRNGSEGGTLGKADRAFLAALAQFPDGRTKAQAAFLAGYSPTVSTSKNALGRLRSRGYIEGTNEQLRITPAGLEALGDDWELAPTGRALAEFWFPKLGKADEAFLRALVDRYPDSLTKAEVAQIAGYDPNVSTTKNALGRLRTQGLIVGGSDAIRASDALVG